MSYDNQPIAQNQPGEHELGWDDQIQNDGEDFVVLPAALYPFTVLGFDRGRHNGSAKLPPCNKAMLKVKIHGGQLGEVTISKHQLFLHSKTEGLICQFFRSIGARKHGEALVMDWNAVPGATGFCKLKIRQYKANENDVEFSQINEIKNFVDPDHSSVAAWHKANALQMQQQLPVQQQTPPVQQQQMQQAPVQQQQQQMQQPPVQQQAPVQQQQPPVSNYDPGNPF